jgi:hypothetical protein
MEVHVTHCVEMRQAHFLRLLMEVEDWDEGMLLRQVLQGV